MKVNNRLGIKIVKLTNMEDVVGEVFSGEDHSGQNCIFVKDAFIVNLLGGTDPSNSIMNMSPWSPLTDDELVPIYYDSIVTMFNAKKSFAMYYSDIRTKWKNLPDNNDEFKSRSERMDDWDEPTDEQLDILEAMLLKKGDGTIH